MVAALVLAATSCGPADVQSPDALVGHWLGNVSHRDATARLEFDIERRGDSLVARFTSDEWLVRDLPIGRVSYAPPRVHFVVPCAGDTLVFDGWLRRNLVVGALSPSRGAGEGRSATQPQLSLRHTYASEFPYRVDALQVSAGDAPRLRAPLYLPSMQGPYPGVLLVDGAGAGRAAALADRLARAGFAALVLPGSPLASPQSGSGPATGAAEAAAGFEALRARADVESGAIGLMAMGLDAAAAARLAAAEHAAYLVLWSAPLAPAGMPQRWPSPALPVLALYGERDTLTASAAAAELLRDAMRAAGAVDARVRVIPRAGQALTLAPAAGEPFDWPREAPGLMDSVVTWMRVRLAGR
jgi:dienelactone hydrolase